LLYCILQIPGFSGRGSLQKDRATLEGVTKSERLVVIILNMLQMKHHITCLTTLISGRQKKTGN